jgi:hypothetical protein
MSVSACSGPTPSIDFKNRSALTSMSSLPVRVNEATAAAGAPGAGLTNTDG